MLSAYGRNQDGEDLYGFKADQHWKLLSDRIRDPSPAYQAFEIVGRPMDSLPIRVCVCGEVLFSI